MRIEIQRVGDWKGMKAAFKVITDEGIEIEGFKIVERAGVLSISVPSEKGKDRNGRDKWFERVRMPREIEDRIKQDALAAYREKMGAQPEAPDRGAHPI